jgi:hypothetical protein
VSSRASEKQIARAYVRRIEREEVPVFFESLFSLHAFIATLNQWCAVFSLSPSDVRGFCDIGRRSVHELENVDRVAANFRQHYFIPSGTFFLFGPLINEPT